MYEKSKYFVLKEKAIRHYVDLIVTVFDENSEITQGGWGRGGRWMPIKDVQEWGVPSPKLDVCG